MPTGTGKTETMLALLVCERLERLLVVVPTAALREQLTAKFLALGVLKASGVLAAGLYPIVGTLHHRPRSPAEVDAFFRRCNVVVTTMAVVGGCDEAVQRWMVECTSHLFIDEAHHISARSWDAFRRTFLERPILQFTATPFRGDGKHVGGKVIFNYPLRKAQVDGYFTPILFRPVEEYDLRRSDAAIARVAIHQLEQDLAAGFDHLIMARAADIGRATQVHAVYAQRAPTYRPLLIHSQLSAADQRAAMRQLRERETRIVVCVDMLGEGFDLPELKIAALHNVHKSLAITLQFTGRFTRAKPSLGQATMIANLADAEVEGALRQLYAESADWNVLLRQLSEGATSRQVERSAFLEGFATLPAAVPLQNILPKMSTVVYRTAAADWQPDAIRDLVPEDRLFVEPAVNAEHHVLLFVTCERVPIPWGDIKDLYNTVLDLYLLHWDAERGLLYIHSSNKDGAHEELAEAVLGEDVTLIRGEQVFRVMHGINRLVLMNLGLRHALSHSVRFTMYAGADILDGLAQASLTNRVKSNLFGRGYESGDKASAGCSYRGRIWSHRIAQSITEWLAWCHAMGTKLIDETIAFESILQHVLRPEQVHARPPLVPLVIEWPEEFLERSEEAIQLDIAGDLVPFYEAGLELVDHRREGPLRFRVFTEQKSVEYEVLFLPQSVEYRPTGAARVHYVVGRQAQELGQRFQQDPPVIRFEDGAELKYDALLKLAGRDEHPFDVARIVAWDWAGTDIRVESQKTRRYARSIQYRVIQELLRTDGGPRYDIVFDDDGSNEAADVVALKVAGEHLLIHFFHCKFSRESTPGARIEDLYAVCGQAQRSVHWKRDPRQLLEHLRRREARRLQASPVSRFERGDLPRLREMTLRAPLLIPQFTISIVQPGLARHLAKAEHLKLLAVTELYLQETYAAGFQVIASA